MRDAPGPLEIDQLLAEVADWASAEVGSDTSVVFDQASGAATSALLARALQARKWRLTGPSIPVAGSRSLRVCVVDDGADLHSSFATSAAERCLYVCVALQRNCLQPSDDLLLRLVSGLSAPTTGFFTSARSGDVAALALLTHAGGADRSDLRAISAFAGFRQAAAAAHARRLGDRFAQAMAVLEPALHQLADAEATAFVDRHSLKQIARNLSVEARYRLGGTARPPLPSGAPAMASRHGWLKSELAAEQRLRSSPTSLLESLAASALQTRVGLLIESTHTFGGLEQWVCDFARDLSRQGYRPYLFVRDGVEQSTRIEAEFPGEIVWLGKEPGRLVEAIDRYRPSALFVNHSYDDVGDLPTGILVVEVLHNLYFWQRFSEAHATARRRVDVFVAVSASVAEYSTAYLGVDSSACMVIPHSLNHIGFMRPQRDYLERRRTSEHFNILAVGNIYPQKNFLCLVRAFAKVRMSIPNARLRIVGSASQREFVHRIEAAIADMGMADAVCLLGSLSRKELSREYANANIFVLPSLYEGFGLATLEARFYGLPLVLSNTGHFSGMIEDGAIVEIANIAQPLDCLDAQSVQMMASEPPDAAVDMLAAAIGRLHEHYALASKRALDAREAIVPHHSAAYIDLLREHAIY